MLNYTLNKFLVSKNICETGPQTQTETRCVTETLWHNEDVQIALDLNSGVVRLIISPLTYWRAHRS